jgi:hypothetical protein
MFQFFDLFMNDAFIFIVITVIAFIWFGGILYIFRR